MSGNVNRCAACGQFSGAGHSCPSTLPQKTVITRPTVARAGRPSRAGSVDIAARVARARSAVREAAPRVPISMESVGPVYEHVRATWPLSRFGLGLHQNTNRERWLTVSMIEVEPDARGRGVGSDVMSYLADVADENGWTLALTPDHKVGGYDEGRLRDWYASFGFAANEGRNQLFMCDEAMIRRPGTTTTRRSGSTSRG